MITSVSTVLHQGSCASVQDLKLYTQVPFTQNNRQIEATWAAGIKPRTLLLQDVRANHRSLNGRKIHTTRELMLIDAGKR